MPKLTTSIAKDVWAHMRVWKLKQLANITGTPSAGNRRDLINSILQSSCRLSRSRPHVRDILSIDMGIRNLAYCILRPVQSDTQAFELRAWNRLDVVPATPTEPASSWSPAALAPHAVRLTRHLLTQGPDATILIERQRYRSGGASQVQEWTLRVNTLEAMLWSALHVLRRPDSLGPETLEMSPARICSFWHGRNPSLLDRRDEVVTLLTETEIEIKESDFVVAASSKKGFAKGEKIELVRRWIDEGSLVLDTNGQKELEDRLMAFVAGRKAPSHLREKKLDDLADCVVQAVTYALWEDNRNRIMS